MHNFVRLKFCINQFLKICLDFSTKKNGVKEFEIVHAKFHKVLLYKVKSTIFKKVKHMRKSTSLTHTHTHTHTYTHVTSKRSQAKILFYVNILLIKQITYNKSNGNKYMVK